jgi:hypothetical protein
MMRRRTPTRSGDETRNGSVAWHEAVAATAAYQRVLSGPIDCFRITQGPVQRPS